MTTQFQGFNSFQPLVSNGAAAPYSTAADTDTDKGSSSGKGTSLGGLDLNMIKFLYENGLKSDVEGFMNEMEFAIENAYNPITGKPNVAMYKLLIPKLMQIKNEKEEYDKALKEVQDKDAMNDYAVRSDGKILAMWNEDGKVQRGWMSSGELVNKFGNNFGDKVRLITNGELAKERSTSVGSAFNRDITNVLAGATGLQTITKYIKDYIPKLGTTIQLETLQKGVSSQNTQLLDSVEALTDLINGVKHSTYSKDLKGQATLALNYILNTLPKNMRTLLDVSAAKSGLTANSLIESYLGAQMDSEYKETLVQSFPKSGKGSGSGDEYKGKLTPPMEFMSGYGVKTNLHWRGEGTFEMNLPASVMSLTKGNDVLGMTTLSNVKTSDFGSLLNTSLASFGDVTLKGAMGNNVLVDGSALYKIDLPIDLEAYQATGIIKPDLRLLDNLLEAERYIKLHNITEPDEINEVYQNFRLPAKYANENGNRKYEFTGVYRTFAAMNAYAPEQAFNKDPSLKSNIVQMVEDENERLGVEQLLKEGKPKESQTAFSGATRWYTKDDILYKSILYIPVNENWANALISAPAGATPTAEEAIDILEPLQQHNDRVKSKRDQLKPQVKL